MVTNRWGRTTALALLGGLVWGSLVTSAARAEDRPAAKILDEIRGVEMPQIGAADRSNRQAVQAFLVKRQAAMEKKAGLIGELYKQHPDNPELVQLLPERWQALASSPKTAKEADSEIDSVIASSKNDKLVNEASFLKVFIAFRNAGAQPNLDQLMPVVTKYVEKFPKDPRGAMLLSAMAELAKDDSQKDAINQRIEKNYPDSAPAQSIAATRRLKAAVGKPFPIDFTDAIKGSPVNSASLKGKVVVVDFWATWCGPCVAEMPKMKKLYAEYKDKGVEFVGISLDSPRDEGGYDKLKAYVEKNQIEWPQYYQGNGWESEFSKSWGINSIPAVFVVDADGNLANTEARGKLEELIPEMLAKAKKDKKAE